MTGMDQCPIVIFLPIEKSRILKFRKFIIYKIGYTTRSIKLWSKILWSVVNHERVVELIVEKSLEWSRDLDFSEVVSKK